MENSQQTDNPTTPAVSNPLTKQPLATDNQQPPQTPATPSPQQAEPITQPSTTPSKKKSFFKLIVGFIIILVLAAGYYTYQYFFNKPTQETPTPTPIVTQSPPIPTTNPTTDWKTYTNTTYEFSLNYPPTLKIVSTSDYAADLVEQGVEQKNITPSNIKVRISVNQISRNFDKIYSALNNAVVPEEQRGTDATFTKKQNRVIGGYKAVDYTYNVPGNETSKSYSEGTIINKGGTLIEISTWDSKSISNLNQILSTFKFLEKECPEGKELQHCKLGPCCCPIGAICD